MAESKLARVKARLPAGFRDRDTADIAAEARMLGVIARVYESYGFSALATPAFEFTDALGKFLPDSDRPNEGVFSLEDDDGQWMSLRYDLTAPLARYVAQHYQNLPKPFRRYAIGTVWRNEKPGPGRFREFTQCDADTVGSAAPAADAEMLMMFADTLEAVGLKRGEYVVKLNSRKLLDGVLDAVRVAPAKRPTVMRAIDKLDRLGLAGVTALLGVGRKDESGDFTEGAELDAAAIARILAFVAPETAGAADTEAALVTLASVVVGSEVGEVGIAELREIVWILKDSGYGADRVRIDSGIVRGLDYYTGPVFEAQLTGSVQNAKGETVVFGSVGGGGRYDGLVARFLGQPVPATGISIGVSRLLTSLRQRGLAEECNPLVVVTVFDAADVARAFSLAADLRAAGLRAEAYVGKGRLGDQLKYADKRGAAVAIIEGADERARAELTLKDLALGAELAKDVDSRAAWVENRPAQQTVKRADLVGEIRKMLDSHVHRAGG